MSRLLLIGLWTVIAFSPALKAEVEQKLQPQPAVRIGLIIDDLGNQKAAGERAINLPGPVTYAFLPQTPFTWQLAIRAHELDKEVMLHLPMESDLGNPLGNGALTLAMPKSHFVATLKRNLASVPYVVGVNNHMGSLLTRDPTAMRWIMSELRRQGLYFIDSRTTELTVAERVAQRHLISSGRRDVFLDNVPEQPLIREQLQKLVAIARERGEAIGIGHPYRATLDVLQEELPKLKQQGIELVPVSQIIKDRRVQWHASSSP
ncbi:MAG: divergent polysaccharide deacetylase family protein [Candidatus Thiodiazotropha sp. (ex Ctena orbiculata)]|nr:divergent polysaccharide deacetylase family protein [Candidatus Thiodiazotropha taylori]